MELVLDSGFWVLGSGFKVRDMVPLPGGVRGGLIVLCKMSDL